MSLAYLIATDAAGRVVLTTDTPPLVGRYRYISHYVVDFHTVINSFYVIVATDAAVRAVPTTDAPHLAGCYRYVSHYETGLCDCNRCCRGCRSLYCHFL